MKRFICFLFAIMVAVVPSFAWNAESFLEIDYDSQDIYSFDPVYEVNDRGPMMFASRPRSSSGSSSVSLLDLLVDAPVSYDKSKVYVQGVYRVDYYPYVDVVSFPSGGINLTTPFSSAGGVYIAVNTVNVPSSYNGYPFLNCAFPAFFDVDTPIPDGDDPDNYLRVTIDVSSYNSSVVSFDGSVYFASILGSNFSYHDFDLYVDDSLVGSFQRELGGFIWSNSKPISSITFVFKNALYNSPSSGNYTAYLSFRPGTAVISFLREDSALSGFNDQAQSDINQHNQIESEWTGSMTSNFDALDIDNFTFPVGLVSAFGLISGVFNDLWHGMGEYRIVYVFPLMLGIVLLLVGRLSKFSGGQSSSVNNRGDSSA